MIRNYLRVALRNITRHKFIAFINIAGLTIGLTCCLLILAYIMSELSFDKYNRNAANIYRVTRSFNNTDGVINLHLGAVAPPFAPLLKNEFPDIKKITRVFPNGSITLRYKEKLFNEQGSVFADENFLSMFDVTTLRGNPNSALAEPNSVMLTQELAKKYFGNDDPINREIRLGNQINFKVTGVFKALPYNAHFHPNMLLSFNTLNDSTVYGRRNLETNWGNNSFYTYMQLPSNYNLSAIASRLPAFLDKYMPQDGRSKPSAGTKLYLQKLTDIHLRSHLDSELDQNGDIKRVYVFSAIALFILLIACINYMNLSTARSTLRAKEIGIRKVVGAQQKQIIWQFLGESIMITYISLALAFTITALVVPAVNNASSMQLSIDTLLHPALLIIILIVPFAIGILSGIYPALFMSSFNPAKVLKGIYRNGSGGLSFRKVLVVTQFSVTIILIVATIVVFQQLDYMRSKSLGINKDYVVTLANGVPADQFESFKADLLRSPSVKGLSRSSRLPSGRLLDNQGISIFDGEKQKDVIADVKYLNADYGFIPTFGIQMAAGRNFSKDFPTDSLNYILNETAVVALGWKSADKAIGKEINYGGVRGKVIGVTKDFHFESLHQRIVPMILRMPSFSNNNYGRVAVKIDGNNVNAAIKQIEHTWKSFEPEVPLEYTFLDERFQRLYNTEQEQGKLFTMFSCLAIFIACLGLFGLSAFTISQRVKEVGVRKVLGATITQIVAELSKDFLKLVIIASVIALPIAWYTMNQWLMDFAFRINIQWWVLAAAAVTAIIIAFATVSYQSLKAALANPVKSLRSE